MDRFARIICHFFFGAIVPATIMVRPFSNYLPITSYHECDFPQASSAADPRVFRKPNVTPVTNAGDSAHSFNSA
jgi:hypothetical protein